MSERFNIPDLPPVASPGETSESLTASFDYAQAGLNTLDHEAALDRLLLHGVGRIFNRGARLQKGDDGILHLTNGYFVAGPGTTDEDSELYFVGARLVRVNGEAGYIEIDGANAPPDSATSFGHLSASGAVTWAEAPIVPRPGDAWLIGSVTVDGAGLVTAVDDSMADIVGSSSGGSGEGESLSDFLEDYKWSRADPRLHEIVFDEKLNAAIAPLSERIDEIAGPSAGTAQIVDSYLLRDVARLEVAMVERDPQFSLVADASIAIPGIAGNGEILGIDEDGANIVARDVHTGNTVYNELTGEES